MLCLRCTPGCLVGPSSITVLPGLRFTAGHFLLPAQCYGAGKRAGLSDTINASFSQSHLSPRSSQTRLLGRAAPADPKHPVA